MERGHSCPLELAITQIEPIINATDKSVRASFQKFKQMDILQLLIAFIIFVGIIYAVYKIVIFTQRNLKSFIHKSDTNPK